MPTGKVNFITHKGKEILFLDYAGSGPADILAIIDEGKKAVSSRPEKAVMTLSDFTDVRFDESTSSAIKEFTAHNKPYVRAGAVVGVTGLKRIIFEAAMKFSGRRLSTFSTIDEAKDWLATQ